jgi:predicted amino acid dehydrogenase
MLNPDTTPEAASLQDLGEQWRIVARQPIRSMRWQFLAGIDMRDMAGLTTVTGPAWDGYVLYARLTPEKPQKRFINGRMR